MRSSFLIHFISKACILFSVSAIRFRSLTVSWTRPGSSTACTWFWSWCCLSISFGGLAMDAVALAIWMRTSAVQVLSLDRAAPRYLKLSFCLSVSPFIVMFAAMSFLLLTMIFDFSELTSIPNAPALSTNLLVRYCIYALLPPIRLMSSVIVSCRFACHRWR